jgi:predicted dehydrogenase
LFDPQRAACCIPTQWRGRVSTAFKEIMQSRLNIAIIGAGGMGHVWTDTIKRSSSARLVAIVDPLLGTDQEPQWTRDHPDLARHTGLSKLDVDAVIVTASTPAHEQIIETALGSGWHVLVEKPFVTDLDAARRLVELAERAGKVLMVSQNYRFFTGPVYVRQLTRERRYGQLRSVIGRFWCDWPGRPYQRRMMHPMLLEMAIHHLDMVRAMFDANAASGTVQEWNSTRSPYRMGGAVEAVYQMAGDGSSFPFLYSGSLISTAPRTPWPGLWRFEFDDATLIVDRFDGRYALYRGTADGHEFLSDFESPILTTVGRPFDHFVECIREAKEPCSSGRDNLETLRMALGFLSLDET